jgi:dynein heavy chain
LMTMTYLSWFMKDDLLEETELYPFNEGENQSFKTCMPTTYEKYLAHIDDNMGVDTPVAFGLHTNAEIDFRTTQAKALFHTLAELSHDEGGGGGGGDDDGKSEARGPMDIARDAMADIAERFGERFIDAYDVEQSLEEVGPYQNVFLQEIEAMNKVTREMKRSLHELDLGFKGELTMSETMEDLQKALIMDRIPDKWKGMSWPSRRTLTPWLFDMARRLDQLVEWTAAPDGIPMVTWLSGLITPQSFLTAICQVSAQKNQMELDKLMTQVDVKKWETPEQCDAPSRDGAFCSGLSMQGARWNLEQGLIERAKPKEMFCPMPIIGVRAVLIEKADWAAYQCPCYKTTFRGPEWIFNCQLKSKADKSRWVLAGVGLICDVTN